MDEKKREKLKKYREVILKKMGKDELLQQTESKELLQDIKELLRELLGKDVVETKVITKETLPDLVLVKDLLKKILNKEPIKIEQKNLRLPSIIKTKVTNFPKEPSKVEVVNIADTPKIEIDIWKPVKWLFDQVKTFFNPIIDYVSEPKSIEITDNEIIEIYANKTIKYHFGKNTFGEITRIERNES